MADQLPDLYETLAKQHPLLGDIGETYKHLGGQDFLNTWALNNPTTFVKLMFNFALPRMAPTSNKAGEISITIHNDLPRTSLDHGLEVVDGEFVED